MPRIHLKPGRERSLARRHPWVFSGAIDHVEGNPGPGEVVEVRTSQGGFAAWAGYSPDSQIRARVWDWHERTRVDQAFIAARVAR
ncbi:MAG: 23S rRNA (cytosine(1962)-C(5))-methyltransferase RlmI, partial [Rubrivivax sp.]